MFLKALETFITFLFYFKSLYFIYLFLSFLCLSLSLYLIIC